MCEKPEHSRNIDPCLQDTISMINNKPGLRTILSCCGHGKYPSTIIVFDKIRKVIYEYFSGTILKLRYRNGKIRHRYYVKDKMGIYYLPEFCSK